MDQNARTRMSCGVQMVDRGKRSGLAVLAA